MPIYDNLLQIPSRDKLVDSEGMITPQWLKFFQNIVSLIDFISPEIQFTITNNQTTPADITPLSFDYRYTSLVKIEYLIQRITNSTDIVSCGELFCNYEPFTGTWSIREPDTPGPDAHGITFSITSDGQVRYTSSNVAGATVYDTRAMFRVFKMAAKNKNYSALGR